MPGEVTTMCDAPDRPGRRNDTSSHAIGFLRAPSPGRPDARTESGQTPVRAGRREMPNSRRPAIAGIAAVAGEE